jgi:pSer/pThr/pTyr-binding forkhead associated (FHA) protein
MQLQLQLPDRGFVPVSHGLRIGRDPRNDVVLSGASVSRWHAVILPTRGGLAVRDEHSMNGTFVNDQRLHGMRALQAGDSVRVGIHTLRVAACANVYEPGRMPAAAAHTAQAQATRLPRQSWIIRRHYRLLALVRHACRAHVARADKRPEQVD